MGDSTRAKEDSLEDLRNLKQEFNLQDYWNSFNKLYSKARVQEEQALNFFLNGLVDELQLVVRMFKLKTIADAYNLAKLQELTVATILHKSKPSTKPTTFVKAEIEVLKFDEDASLEFPGSTPVSESLVSYIPEDKEFEGGIDTRICG
ncbi:hypothetical protein GH714_030373 [Hevea brasiliensis]|uniref:Retrotransposon gag domain-containing protein n=1 Tax=Hevea brasiliensis TaxID=3981 RepID=A0A6A6KD61_HEVBR|nr:hypothetical protein GH714_030373 [Hevea brasiliensis]